MKSKQELIEEWESAIEAAEFYGKGKEERLISYMKDFVSDLNQLDEPEVLSEEKVIIEGVWAKDIEGAKASGMTLFEAMDWMAIDCDDKEKQDLFARAWLDGYTVEKQKYYAVKSEGLDGVHYYFTKFDDEMNGLFTLPNDKKKAYKFDDKEKAQAIANYTDSKVEEMEE